MNYPKTIKRILKASDESLLDFVLKALVGAMACYMVIGLYLALIPAV